MSTRNPPDAGGIHPAYAGLSTDVIASLMFFHPEALAHIWDLAAKRDAAERRERVIREHRDAMRDTRDDARRERALANEALAAKEQELEMVRTSLKAEKDMVATLKGIIAMKDSELDQLTQQRDAHAGTAAAYQDLAQRYRVERDRALGLYRCASRLVMCAGCGGAR